MNKAWKKAFIITAGVGGVNWGLNHLFQLNLVDKLFSTWPWLVWVVYVFIGISGAYAIYDGITDE